MNTKKLLITGANGFLGSHLIDSLVEQYSNQYELIPLMGRADCDLTKYDNVIETFSKEKPDIVIHIAAQVGGIGANRRYPGEFLYNNLQMGLNVIECSRICDVKKFILISTVCAYPKSPPYPFKEIDIWNGYPEETNAPYGLSKKILMELLKSYRNQYGFPSISLIPTNLYGPRDSFNLDNCHVIPALMNRLQAAANYNDAVCELWGTGTATREFLYVKDCVDAIIKTLNLDVSEYNADYINIGSEAEISISDLAAKIAKLVKYKGILVWNDKFPDGQPRRKLDCSKAKAKLNFTASTSFNEGLLKTYEYFILEELP